MKIDKNNFTSKEFIFGGDYNPEQWPENTWQDDINKLKEANINTVTINVFSWTLLQPEENKFDFGKLKRIVLLLKKNNLKIIMATSTAALPFWLVRKYPEVSRVDQLGIRQRAGKRHNACPNSPIFQQFSKNLVNNLGKEFGNDNNIICWHISNEYGGYCYCENCAINFRKWLHHKYGSIENLNKEWNTNYWNHKFEDWKEVIPPTVNSDLYVFNRSEYAVLMPMVLDYNRFQSDSLLKNYRDEYKVLRKYSKKPITTNLMSYQKDLDYNEWGKYLDIVSWDNYPKFDTSGAEIAMEHDLMYGIKEKPFLLMEQTPTQQNWNMMLKKPGQMRMLSLQSIAHGSNSVMFFQMKQSKNGMEQYHGAIISHSLRTDTRVFKEITNLGYELTDLSSKSDILNSEKRSNVALIFDWNNYWACNCMEDTNRVYIEKCLKYYRAIFKRHLNIDVISPNKDLSKYKLVIAPFLYIVTKNQREKIEKFVSNGGVFISTPMSGMVDENDNVYMGGYPGALKKLMGIWVEEFDILRENESISAIFKNGNANANNICDIIHLQGASPLAIFGPGKFYSGKPVVTKNRYGKGVSYYLGSDLDRSGIDLVLSDAFAEANLNEKIILAPDDIDITTRFMCDGKKYFFIINTSGGQRVFENPFEKVVNVYNGEKIGDEISLKPYDVLILKDSGRS